MNTELIEFLRTGSLGSLSLNLSLEDAAAMLGKPSAVGLGNRQATVLKYADLQLSFIDNKLVLLAVYLHNGKAILPAGVFDHVRQVLLEEKVDALLLALSAAQIKYAFNPQMTFGDQTVYIVGSRICVLTDNTTGSVMSIQLASELELVAKD